MLNIPVWPVVRVGLVVTAVLALPSLGVAQAARGGSAAVAVVLGFTVVVVFFTTSKVVVALVARHAREFLLPAAVGTYIIKIILLGMLLLTVGDVDAVDTLALAWAVFVAVFGWVGAELWVATHTRVPFYDPQEFERRNSPRRDTLHG